MGSSLMLTELKLDRSIQNSMQSLVWMEVESPMYLTPFVFFWEYLIFLK